MTEQTAHDAAWEQALEEAINQFEQGETVSEAQFAELVAELEKRQNELRSLSVEEPTGQKLAHLRERAARLAQSAAEGTGPTDQVSSILAKMTGSD